MDFGRLTPPASGEPIRYESGKLVVPDQPILPFITGDGVGIDVTPAMRAVLDAAVAKCYGGKRKLHWWELPAGESCNAKFGEYMLPETVAAIREYRVAIKGPMATPVGGGRRSLNVALRQDLDLYSCVRPVRWFPGVPSPVKEPQKLDVVIFRENTEDLYLGIEFAADTAEADKLIEYINGAQKKKIKAHSAIGIKPMSKAATERIAEAAIQYALRKGRKTITLVHKGNIMKFTEGAFREWGYAYYKAKYRDLIVTEEELGQGASREGKILVNDRIADAMFQQILLRPDEYSVVVTPNLNGDYISDAAAAQVGGLGIAPGSNEGDGVAVFEATHGTAPKHAGKDKVNPGSLILSACMMLEFMGWPEAAIMIERAFEDTIKARVVTYDLARQTEGATEVSCSAFAKAMIERM